MTPFQQKQLVLMRQMEERFDSGSAAATVVPQQTDYAANNQLCLTVNTIIPKTLAAIIQTRIIERLKSIDPKQYYYPNESLHITLHSVRIIHNPPSYTARDIETSKVLLAKYIPREPAFPFILQGVMSLPTSVAIIALITPEYDAFIRTLRRAFIGAGIPDDKKYFTDKIVFANTTICRYTHPPSQKFLQELQKQSDEYFGELTATNVSLIETNAVAHPSKTRVLDTYRFKNIHG